MDKLAFFLAHAPQEIPKWFEVVLPNRPKPPKEPEINGNVAVARCIMDYKCNPHFDLAGTALDLFDKEIALALATWAMEMDEYRVATAAWEIANDRERYFAWRTFYAREMLDRWSKERGCVRDEVMAENSQFEADLNEVVMKLIAGSA